MNSIINLWAIDHPKVVKKVVEEDSAIISKMKAATKEIFPIEDHIHARNRLIRIDNEEQR
jgi:hypothetical protein